MKIPLLTSCLFISLGCGYASAAPTLSAGGTGTIGFDDISSGGVLTTNALPPTISSSLPYVWGTPYDSLVPSVGHVDHAAIDLNIQDAGGMPWVAGNATLTQLVATPGTIAQFSTNFNLAFTGLNPTDDISLALASMAYHVFGNVGGSSFGPFVFFSQHVDIFNSSSVHIHSLDWTFTDQVFNTTFNVFVTPQLNNYNLASNQIGDSSISMVGTIFLQADPSSISIDPVPEPAAWSSFLLGLGGLLMKRRRG